MALKLVPIWACCTNQQHCCTYPQSLKLGYGSSLSGSTFLNLRAHKKWECLVLLSETEKAITPVEDEEPLAQPGDASVQETHIIQSKGFHRDLQSLPKPLSATDLSCGHRDGSKVRVAYQGSPGAYSEAAALKAYPKCEPVPCDQFEAAFKAVELWLVDKAVLPIENSVAGSIHRNYDLLLRHRLHIVGEVQLLVNHCLLGLPGSLFSSLSTGTEAQPDAVTFETLEADVVLTTSGFFSDNDESDLDCPTKGFSSIPEAIEDIRQGKMVLVTDDEGRENEGDLVMAASKATPEAMAFFVKHGTGIVCVSMVEEHLERLQLPLMVNDKKNEEKLCTAFTVSVDAKHGTTTGVSAHDRATTVLALASRDSKPEDFNRPGHIFPLKYREGGVLKRAGHTEASVDLAMLAGLDPVGVICEVVDDDGSMARLPMLRQFAKEHNLKIISVADLIRYRRKTDQLVEHASAARIPTMWGPFTAHCFKSIIDGIEHIAMVKGDIGDGQDILVRVHSECLTGDIFGSARCDCGSQLALAMQNIEAAGRGVLVYLRGHEGRGIGLGHKLRAYNLQDAGRDTVEANEELGLPIDSREYGVGAQMLRDLGVRTMKLMTNNPAKYSGLKGYGLAISGRVPLLTPITKDNKRYLETKRAKMGHVYGLNLIRPATSTSTTNGKPNSANTSTVQNSNVSTLGN